MQNFLVFTFGKALLRQKMRNLPPTEPCNGFWPSLLNSIDMVCNLHRFAEQMVNYMKFPHLIFPAKEVRLKA